MTQPLILAHQTNSITINDAPGTATDQLVTKRYVDQGNYTIYGPKVGQSADDSKVPIYSDFKFSLGATRVVPFDFVDNQSRQVMYFASKSTTDVVSWFRAYRYSDTQTFVYDNEPLSVPGLNVGERLTCILNLGTYYITVFTSSNRALLLSTNGSSAWREWTIAYDVSSLVSNTYSNAALVSTPSGDRILRYTYDADSATPEGFTLEVYNSSLTLLRSQRLFKYTELDFTDYTGQGRLAGVIKEPETFVAYTQLGRASSFCWNKATGTFTSVAGIYKPYANADGSVVEFGFGLTVSWNIPASWIESGVGTPTNNITVKSGSYRYRIFPDSTWDTDTGGMTQTFVNFGNAIAAVVDEYGGQTMMNVRWTWDSSTIGMHYRTSASYNIKSVGANIEPYLTSRFTGAIPDGSAWAKTLSYVRAVGSRLVFQAYSVRYGDQWVSVPFSTTSFSSVTAPSDTLKLASASTQTHISVNAGVPEFTPRYMSTVVVSGTPIHVWCCAGHPIFKETMNADGTVTYTATSVNVPNLPATLGSVTIKTNGGGYSYVWNGSTSSPVVYCIVQATNNLQYAAKWTGGAWALATTATISDLAINTGNNSRHSTDNLNDVFGNSIWTEGGKWLFCTSVPVVGNSNQFVTVYDLNANTYTTVASGEWLPTGVNGTGQYIEFDTGALTNRGFDYSSTFGYLHYVGNHQSYVVALMSSRNVQTGATISEAQWLANSPARFQKFVTTEAATGLVAYMVQFPILLGGYVTNTPERAIALYPNTVNYIYVTKDPSDISTVTTSVDTVLTPSSFSRILVAAITTNATDVVSSVQYSYDGSGLPSYSGMKGRILSNDGTQLVWKSASGSVRTETASTVVVQTDNAGTILLNANNLTVTIPVDTSLPIGTKVTVYVSGGFTGNKLAPASGAVLTWVGSGGGASGVRSLGGQATVELRKITQSQWFVHGQGIS